MDPYQPTSASQRVEQEVVNSSQLTSESQKAGQEEDEEFCRQNSVSQKLGLWGALVVSERKAPPPQVWILITEV